MRTLPWAGYATLRRDAERLAGGSRGHMPRLLMADLLDRPCHASLSVPSSVYGKG